MSTVYVRFDIAACAAPLRVPLLERLLAFSGAPLPAGDWRRDAFELIAAPAAPMPGVAAAVRCAAERAPAPAAQSPPATLFMASPVHLVAGMSSVSMAAEGVLRLDLAEAGALADDFNRVFAGTGTRLTADRRAELICEFEQPVAASTRDPRDVAGREGLGVQATGDGAARVRRCMSEIELWLFEHSVNRARAARSLPAVTGLWLWGGGAKLRALPAVRGWTAGNDPLFAAYGARDQLDTGAPGVIVLEAGCSPAAWCDIERRWLQPALRAVRTGRLRELRLSAGDRLFRLTPLRSWRMWRRPHPWWESFAVPGGRTE